ncbi:MAG: tetratricopeptide repeat protein [Anaerolineae bacterium]
MLEVRLLGTFDIKCGKKVISLASRPAQSLFAFLILNAGTAYRREKLAGQLWPDSTEEQARDYLRHALWRVRKALQAASAVSYLKADDLTISFDAMSDYWLDAAALQVLGADAPTETMAAVLGDYRGELLPGFYDEWAVLEREHLQALYEQRMSRLLEMLQERRDWSGMLQWAERWIALGQKPEAAYRFLMTAHAAQGDMAKAVAAYERCVQSLAEFGVEPSEQTRALMAQLKTNKGRLADEPVDTASRPAQRAGSTLPVPLTGFIGRQKELTEITRLLRDRRLVTLVGPGGVGKTRLAIEAAHRVAPRFAGGVWWIDLVGLSDPDLVPQAVLQALAIPEMPQKSALAVLIEKLALEQTLLILDNCEHLISACASMAAQLLAGTKHLKVMATSREALDILGETTWTVPSLSLPAAEHSKAADVAASESGHLFLERLAEAQPTFELNEQNAGALAQICNRLSGIPLAIELAAARARMMSVPEIARRLEDSFDLLTAGNRAALPRHQTLRATIDWSFDLLSEPERILLRRLAVFAGGCTLDSVEGVASDEELPRAQIVDLLGHLVSKSLVIVQPGAEDTPTRYSMLETIRQYALDKLDSSGEATALRERHLHFFMELAERAEARLFGEGETYWFSILESEIDNLRSAWLWSIAPNATTGLDARKRRSTLGLRLGGALAYFWERNYRQEAIERLRQTLDVHGDFGNEAAKGYMTLGFLYWASTEQASARPDLERAIELAERYGDPYTQGWSRGYLGAVLVALGEYEPAREQLEAAVHIGRQMGERGRDMTLWSAGFLGDIPFAQGDNELARRLYTEALEGALRTRALNLMTYVSRRLGYLALTEGRYADADRYFRDSLEANQRIDHLQGINRCLAAFACLRAAEGKLTEAVELCAVVETFLAKMSASFFHWDAAFFRGVEDNLRGRLSAPTFEKAWKRGTEMSQEQAVALALEPRRSVSENIRNTR